MTDIADLMEKMRVLLAAAPTQQETEHETGQSLLVQPSFALNAPLRQFAQVYGDEGQLLKQLGEDAAAQGDADLATLLATLDQGLRDGEFDLPSTSYSAPRLGRYVYPVV